MKHLKLFASAFIISAISLMSNPAQAATSAEQVLQCTLASFANITANDAESVKTSTITPETGNLGNDLKSAFDIELNAPQTLYLRAKVANSAGGDDLAFAKSGGDVVVVLGHDTNKPTTAAITNAKSSAPAAADNANVITYKVTGVTLTGASAAVTPSFDEAASQYEIAAVAGKSGATTTIGSTVVPNTYSYADTTGTYQATVTLTTSAT